MLLTNPSGLWQLVKTAFNQWMEDKPFQLAAALAYYTIFSLAPLLLIAVAIAGLFFGRDATERQIMTTFQGAIGPQGAEAIESMLENTGDQGSGIIVTIVGVVTLLIGAGGVVGQLQEALNTVWGVAQKPGLGLWGIIYSRITSFAMVLGIGFLLLVSLLATTVLSAVLEFFTNSLPGGATLWHIVELLVSFGLVTLLFAMIYKVLPDVEIAWRDVWVGAAVTALLFAVGKMLLGLYLGRSGITSSYGAAGSFILVLMWVYYSALIFFFGAELTQVYANTYGTGLKPTTNAVVVNEDRAQGEKAEPQTSTSSQS